MSLTLRHFFLGYDVALGRTWEFHDYLAGRPDIVYHLHVIGRYTGPHEDLDDRHYVTRTLPLAAPSRPEVWIIRGWNHPLLVLAAVLARFRRVPILMWQERPGATWEATDLKKAIRIQLRRLLLPALFFPYRNGTVVLGLGHKGVETFRKLSGGSPGHMLPWPNPVADACLSEIHPRKRDDVVRFLFLGNFTRLKAVDLIARACENLWSSGRTFKMRYVGQGPLKDMLEEHVSKNQERAELFPFADRTTLIEHLKEADAVLLPSRRDGWGLPVHEGLAAGVPVIVSHACGAVDLVASSGCGRAIMSDSEAALTEAMSWIVDLSPAERELIQERAVEVAHQLTMPNIADTLLSYCEEALVLVDEK